MAFKRTTSSDTIRQKIDTTQRLMRGYHAMPDAFLARKVLGLAREVRRADPERLGDPSASGYGTLLLWHAIPRACQLLSRVPLQPNEGTKASGMDAREVRELIGNCLNNYPSQHQSSHQPTPIEILTHGFVNGNPVAMIADRIADPAPIGEDGRDWLARHMREISQARFGHEKFDAWAPSFQEYGDLALVTFADEESLDL